MDRATTAAPRISSAALPRIDAHTVIATVTPKLNGFSVGTAGTPAAGAQFACGSAQFTVEGQTAVCGSGSASGSRVGCAMPLAFLGGSAADSDDAGAAGICYR